MQLATTKYKRKGGKLFLSIYTAFILVGVFHYHPYNFDGLSSFSYPSTTNRLSDLSFDDFFTICSLHQFAQTIDNFHYSSANIVQPLTQLDSKLNFLRTNDFTSLTFSQISLRAPPVNS